MQSPGNSGSHPPIDGRSRRAPIGTPVADTLRVVSCRLPLLTVAAALLFAGSTARAQTVPGANTGIYLRTGISLSVLDPSALEFTARSGREARRRAQPMQFSGKQLGWSRGALLGASLGVALDARWFYLRIGAELYAAPEITVETGRYSADIVSLAWAALGPRYAWGPFAVHAGARFGAVVMGLRSENGGLDYAAVTGTYAAEAGFQWRPLRWMEVDATFSQDFSALAATTVTLAASFGWTRR
jgi:hypothetical protein